MGEVCPVVEKKHDWNISIENYPTCIEDILKCIVRKPS